MIIAVAVLYSLGSALVALIVSSVIWVLFCAMCSDSKSTTVTLWPPIIVAGAVFCFTLADHLTNVVCPM